MSHCVAVPAQVRHCCIHLWCATMSCHVGDREEGRTFLGLGWSSADEKKMRTSFSFGRADFSRFIDLQARLLYLENITAELRTSAFALAHWAAVGLSALNECRQHCACSTCRTVSLSWGTLATR